MKNKAKQHFLPSFRTETDFRNFQSSLDLLRVERGESAFLDPENTLYDEVIDIQGNIHIVPKAPEDNSVKVAAIEDALSARAFDNLAVRMGHGESLSIVGSAPVGEVIEVDFVPQQENIDVRVAS